VLTQRLWNVVKNWRTELRARFSKYLVTREVIKVLANTHAQELAITPRNEWALVRSKQIEEIKAVRSGQVFDIVDRRSWAYPYLPEALHRLNQPILKATPFNLRRFLETPIPRRAMNLVKNAVLSFKWEIKPTKDFIDNDDPKREQRIRIATETLRRPNESGDSFRDLLEAGLEDFLSNGAMCIEHRTTPYFKRPTKMWAVDSSTIRLFLDWTESTPDRPRYAQMTGLKGERGIVTFLSDELFYIRDNIRTATPFGLGRAEVAFNCYSDDTEVLTRRGWVNWEKVTKEDELATRDGEGNLVWQLPTKLYKSKYKGKLINFTSLSSDILVTPNHRMYGWQTAKHTTWVTKGYPHRKGLGLLGAPLEFLSAEKVADLPKALLGYPFRVPAISTWKGKLPRGKDFVKVKVEHDFGYDKWNKQYKVNLYDWVAFLGLYVAEGSCTGSHRGISRHSKVPKFIQALHASADTSPVLPYRTQRQYQVTVTQSRKSKWHKEIKQLLGRLPWKFQQRGKANFSTSNKALHSTVSKLGNKYTKFVPQWIKELPPKYIDTFITWACRGDGHFVKSDGRRIYITCSKRLADDMQELFQKIGSSASIRRYKGKANSIVPGGRTCAQAADLYWVIERMTDYETLGYASKVNYDGFVYCASVPNETLYVRRKGMPLWCGNSINAFLGVQDMSARAGADQVHKTWLWWEQTLNSAHINTIRRHIINELEGQAKISMIAGAKAPQVVEVTPVTPQDLLLDWQKFLIQIIAAAFDLSPQALNMDDHPARATAQVMADSDWKNGVVPVATRIQESITRLWLHDVLKWRDLEFIFDDLDEPDLMTRTVITQRLWSVSGINGNEIRKKFGMGPLPGPWGKLTLFQQQMVLMEIQARLTGRASGGSGGMGSSSGGMSSGMSSIRPPSSGSLGSGTSMNFTAEDVAGLQPDELQLYQELGILPDTAELADNMEQQSPGILDQLSDELTEYFQKELAEKEQDEVLPAPVTPAEEKLQQQKFLLDQHSESLAERVINRRGTWGPAINDQVRKNPLRGKYPRSSSGGFVDTQGQDRVNNSPLKTGKPLPHYRRGKGNNAI
jgi:hypothetical protein